MNEFQDNFKIEKLVLVNRLAALKVINKITYFSLHIMESHISIAVNQNIRKYDPMKFDFYYSKWKNEMSLFMLDKCIACLVVRKNCIKCLCVLEYEKLFYFIVRIECMQSWLAVMRISMISCFPTNSISSYHCHIYREWCPKLFYDTHFQAYYGSKYSI